MNLSLNARTTIVALYTLFAIFTILPNFVNLPEGWWLSKEKIVYGLDIQGGAHLVMGVDTKGVVLEKTKRMVRSLESDFKEKKYAFKSIELANNGEEITIDFDGAAPHKEIEDILKDQYGTTLQVIENTPTRIRARYFDAKIREYKDQVIHQAIEVIRNRVDEFGVSEPVIAAQGTDRILVQLPGIKDSARAKDLIKKTAKLDFQIVSEEVTPEKLAEMIKNAETKGNYALGKDDMPYSAYVKRLNADLAGQLPKDTKVVFEKAPQAVTMENGKMPYLVRTDTELGGSQLEDASVMPGEYGEPEVIFKLDSEGRRRFADITGKNVNKRMAVVLDEVVQSAPNIQGRIDSSTARITLGRGRDYQQTMSEANLLATALRAGSLPAALEQLEERTVGPTVGMDAIKKGQFAGAVGILLVFVFMLVYYKGFGAVACLTLTLNLIGLIAFLSAIGATLTLPGIAGIVLTIGMAVDANVIIYERIKEEMQKGSNLRTAVQDGFSNAFSAIWDSNITTAMAGGVLIYFGTGPVKGFGVTLLIGIFTSLFTAVMATKVILDLLIQRVKLKKLPI